MKLNKVSAAIIIFSLSAIVVSVFLLVMLSQIFRAASS
jgi:hypothetical protein